MKNTIFFVLMTACACFCACDNDEGLSGNPDPCEGQVGCCDEECNETCLSYGWNTGTCFDPPQVGAPECECQNNTCHNEDCREECIGYGWTNGACAPDPQPGRPPCDCFNGE